MNKIEQSGLGNSYYSIFHGGQEHKSRKSKNPDISEKQISIKDLVKTTLVTVPNSEIVDNTNNITDELANLKVEKIEKSYASPVEEAWLHPRNIVDVSSDNISLTRKNIKSLEEKGLIDLDIDSIDDNELISQLVCFQSGTLFHRAKEGQVILSGNILAIPIKTSKIYDQGSRNFMYVGNIDIKDKFRKIKVSNTYRVKGKDGEFRSIKIGQKIDVADYKAIEVVKADPDYDRSLIRSR